MENKNITVLYVDDEAIPRLIFEKSFQSKYNIMSADSGQGGLDKMESLKNNFVVIISDMRMPFMNGIEFITEVCEKHKNVACFILTSLDHDDDIDNAIQNNLIIKSFNKPLNVNEIEEAIKSIESTLV